MVQNKRIANVGGGPGGLTLARLLQLKGANVKAYERDFNKDARLIGSPLDMHEKSGTAALRKADLLGELKKNYRPGADKKRLPIKTRECFLRKKKPNPAKISAIKTFALKLTVTH